MRFFVFVTVLMSLVSKILFAEEGIQISEEQLLESVDKHFPLIQAAILEKEAQESAYRASQGAYDAKIVSNNYAVPVGYFTRMYLDAVVEKNIPFANTKIYAGYSYGYAGTFPPQYSTFSTNSLGTPRIGAKMSLLRNFKTDAKRVQMRIDSERIEQASYNVEALRIAMRRDARVAFWRVVGTNGLYQIRLELIKAAERRQKLIELNVLTGNYPKITQTENLQYLARYRAEITNLKIELEQTLRDLSLFYRDDSGHPRAFAADNVAIRFSSTAISDALAHAHDRYANLSNRGDDFVLKRPDMISLKKDLLIQEEQLKGLKNLFLPELDFGVDYTRNLGDEDPSNAPHVLTFMLAFEIPLEYNLIEGNYENLKRTKNALNQRLRYHADQLRLENTQLKASIEILFGKVEQTTEEVGFAKQMLSAEQIKFESGGESLFMVNYREVAKVEAEERKLHAELETLEAILMFEALVTVTQH